MCSESDSTNGYYSTQPSAVPTQRQTAVICETGTYTCVGQQEHYCIAPTTQSSTYCPNGCNGDRCAATATSTPKASITPIATVSPIPTIDLDETVNAISNTLVNNLNDLGLIVPTSTPIPAPSQINMSGVCSQNGGVKVARGCINRSEMLFECMNGRTVTQKCSVAFSCLGTSCNGEDLRDFQFVSPGLLPTNVTPTPAQPILRLPPEISNIVTNVGESVGNFVDSMTSDLQSSVGGKEQLLYPLNGRCICKDPSGAHLKPSYQCDDQTLCCGSSNFNSSYVGMNVCTQGYTNTGRDYNPDLKLQTDTDLQDLDTIYDDGGCGPLTLYNTCELLHQENCSMPEIQGYLQNDQNTFGPTTITTRDGSTHTVISTSAEGMENYLITHGFNRETIFASDSLVKLDDLNDQQSQILADATDAGNVLIVYGSVKSAKGDVIPHFFIFDDCSSNGCKGYDPYFDQYLTVNYSGNAYHIDYSEVGDRISFDKIIAVHPKGKETNEQ